MRVALCATTIAAWPVLSLRTNVRVVWARQRAVQPADPSNC